MPILGTVGIADKGDYNADSTYNTGNFVYHKGSSWLALKNNLRGVTPEEGENWKYLARGFQAELLSAVLATDTTGLVGTAGEQVGAQALMDAVVDRIANQLMKKDDVVSQIVNDATKAASMAALYSVNEYAKSVNKRVDDANSNFPYKLVCRVFNTQTGTIAIKAGETKSVAVDLSADGQYCDGFFCSFSGGMIVDQLYNGSIANYTIGLKNTSNVDISLSGRIFYLVK